MIGRLVFAVGTLITVLVVAVGLAGAEPGGASPQGGGMARMHADMVSGSREMARMHADMISTSPDMARMHAEMVSGNSDLPARDAR